MKRSKVYEAISSERQYQDVIWDEETDKNHSVADWLLFIEQHLNKAKLRVYQIKEDEALNEIRKIAGLCVACGETKGLKNR